jgi:hypothetical protein
MGTTESNMFSSAAFAREYGTFLGLAWLGVFGVYVASIRTANTGLMLLGFVLLMALPVLTFYFARRFKNHIPDNMQVGFGGAYMFSILMLMSASLLSGAGEWVYFQYMDNGAMVAAFQSLLDDPETTKVYEEFQMTDQLTMIRTMLSEIAGLSAFDKVLLLFNNNIFISLILAIPTAFFAKGRPLPSPHIRGGSK